ncbi:pentatricopeptide repeat-containing protein At1g62350 [Spinacia oleracea]|uniref:Pentatricopeptide repeat-containing protein At1g62350 n=1 Tax=Spinacia oleracea TaxID=3562 RepID=A0A9R0JQG0_SPIOL|nr:pentatricopeptide repeat-containing protein At1g62350 [Spinacia oleracea]XP_056699799.1 pentatricopeptide repeat-containing protein At1g62350 [Spinacia oleracea]XP_056699800.1 pentatricopeptide repeat-containing protein At1g62350 [Spinacia oleracea]XP_056699801.1 pentatricopeptide repeat-containing protein At1g62350 [Spinacia oleracea]XP_056699802.1 pentatricopeptide repeat-containing protein At1g62350 [Spinacia oleracea]XP_056699803.1 pentatricopeptide repeat-containing protein At1g62350 [
MFVHTRSAQFLRRAISISNSNSTSISLIFSKTLNPNFNNAVFQCLIRKISTTSSLSSSAAAEGVWRDPNRISIWRRKKEIGKEGLIVAKELKRLQSNPLRLQRCIQSNVSRLLKSDLVSVLAEFQRQDQVFLSMKLYDVVRKEIWYRPDMFFYRDMLMMLARNQKVEETNRVWGDLKREEVLFDQHTFGDIMRAFLDNELPNKAMEIYAEMRQSPDPPLSLPFRVILKGLIPYPELREKIKDDFLELFPGCSVYDPPEDLFDDQDWETESDTD